MSKGTRLLSLARAALLAAVSSTAGLWSGNGDACSELILPVDKTARNAQVVSARTMEFPSVNSEFWSISFKAIERNKAWVSGSDLIGDGKKWTNPYGFVGMTAMEWFTDFELLGTGPYMMDGLNEHGLSAAFLWLYGSKLPEFEADPDALLWVDTVNYILGNFKTVEEVRAAFSAKEVTGSLKVGGLKLISDYIPLHVIVHDSSGKSLLIEWIDETQHLYVGGDLDKYGVVTNEPAWPKMLEELEKKEYEEATPEHEMWGLRADHTPTSRFVKLVKFRQHALVKKQDPIQVATHLINSVDIVHGTDENPDFGDNYTGPTLVRDHTNRKLYFKGQNNQSFRVFDLGKINFRRHGLSRNSILADPTPHDRLYHEYKFAQDVTRLLTAAHLGEPNQSGSTRSTLDVTISVSDQNRVEAPADTRAESMFIYAVTPGREVYRWSGDSWSPLTGGALDPTHTGELSTRTFPVDLDGLPVSAEERQGTKIYAGYGASGTEMLLAGRQELVYVIGGPQDVPRK